MRPETATFETAAVGGGGFHGGASLSGNERDHLFLNDEEGGFEEISALSGLDDPADGRAAVWFDLDQDGWLDVAVANANEPALRLYRNRLGELPGMEGRSVLAVRLVGGNPSAQPSSEWSNRDAIGARIEVDVEDRTLVREIRASEGLASQNGTNLYFGLGDSTAARDVRIRWPSGRQQTLGPVPTQSQLTVYEDPEAAPSGSGVVRERLAATRTTAALPARSKRSHEKLELSAAVGPSTAPLRLLTTTATWCESCRGELPDLGRLRELFGEDELDLVAIPIDPSDTEEKLRAYAELHQPAYRMIYDRSKADVTRVQSSIEGTLRRDVLPASILTDGEDRILGIFWGLPTVSEIRSVQAQG